eukprot:s5143_g4.t1
MGTGFNVLKRTCRANCLHRTCAARSLTFKVCLSVPEVALKADCSHRLCRNCARQGCLKACTKSWNVLECQLRHHLDGHRVVQPKLEPRIAQEAAQLYLLLSCRVSANEMGDARSDTSDLTKFVQKLVNVIRRSDGKLRKCEKDQVEAEAQWQEYQKGLQRAFMK